MTIALLVITNGRSEYLAQTVASATENLRGDITERWMFDDTGDPGHREDLVLRYPEFTHISRIEPQGFGGAISACWDQLAASSLADHVFHLEEDFTFNRPVDLDAMATVLDTHPYLVQLALRRQAWNAEERAAGGVVERFGFDSFTEHTATGPDGPWPSWLEHRLFFTTNPSLYRRALCALPWPTGAESEGRFGHRLLADGFGAVAGPDVRFGYWGRFDSGVAVTHIGVDRTGSDY